LFRCIWKDFGTRFKGVLENLRLHSNLISEQASLLHYQQSQSYSQVILGHIEKYEEDRAEKKQRLKRMEEEERDRKQLAVLGWFSAAPSIRSDHEKFRQTWTESAGSGQWILKNEKVQNWREMDLPVSSMLWINGIPGAGMLSLLTYTQSLGACSSCTGKTILASVLVDSCLQDTSYATSYFYCNEADPEKSNCISIYRGLLSQLLSKCRDLIPYCYEKCLTSGEINLTSTNLAEQLLRYFFEMIPKQFVIIDGLDECSQGQRKLILNFFNTVVDKCDEREPGKLRVLFVSQTFPDIEKALAKAEMVKLTDEDNKKDIESYIKDWSKKLRQLYGLSANEAKFIEDSTMIRSRGKRLDLFEVAAKIAKCS
jgi:archaellum biogenesis ATPase FlaH